MSFAGIGTGMTCSSTKQVSLILHSKLDPSFSYKFNTFVFREPTRCLPKNDIPKASLKYIDGLTLVHPNCVLSADIYPAIIRDGIRSGPIDTLEHS